VLLPTFVGWEWYMGERAILPLRLLKNRTQIGTTLEAFAVFLGLLLGIYYLPLWYQAQGRSATQSGIDILPFQISTVVSAMISGAIINKTGRYWYFLLLSPLLVPVASGLLYTITEFTPHSRVIGYQIILGVGLGGALQNTIIAIQAEYAEEESMVPQATSVVTFGQLVGGILGIAIAGAIFSNGLSTYIPQFAPDLAPDVAAQLHESVTVLKTLDPKQRAEAVHAYVKAIDRVFLLGVPGGLLGTLSALLIKNYNLKVRSAMSGGGGGGGGGVA